VLTGGLDTGGLDGGVLDIGGLGGRLDALVAGRPEPVRSVVQAVSRVATSTSTPATTAAGDDPARRLTT
jgi:hypothetical protein